VVISFRFFFFFSLLINLRKINNPTLCTIFDSVDIGVSEEYVFHSAPINNLFNILKFGFKLPPTNFSKVKERYGAFLIFY